MLYNLVSNIEQCFTLVRDTVPLNLVYYSHLPTAICSLLVGLLVFIKSKRSLEGKILLGIVLSFSFWSFCDVILWTSYDSRMYMFFWTVTLIFEISLFVLSLYLVYVFIDKKDVPFFIKIIWGVLFLPALFVMNTNYYLTEFSITDCVPVESSFYNYYALPLYGAIYLWILALVSWKFRKIEKTERKKVVFLFIGVTVLLLLFLFGKIIANFLIEKGILPPTEGYEYEFYGLFGMPIFLAFIGYLIVKFKAFDIKLIAAQALVVALIILIASQFAFIENNTNKILTGVTLVLSIIGGYVLVKSVQMEVERKEQLQIMTNKLSQANDKLRVLDNAKSEFISIASHQLRTPLTAVKGYASLLLEGSYGKVDGKQKDVLNKMYQSNERLITLVEDMLNLSRIESGRMEYKFENIEIEGVLQEIYDTFVLRAKERNLSFELVKAEKPLSKVKTDRNKIREIISNFTDNAIKYTPEGGVKLKAYERDRKVIVAVSDTGIGIPKEEIPYLFEKFSRGKDTSRLNAGGTGLGLHVGIKMIEELHGKIRVESEGAGKGSTFFVELPVG